MLDSKISPTLVLLLVVGFMQVRGQLDEPLLDLNPLDNTTINVTARFFDMDRVIFLSNMTEVFTANGEWSSIILVILRGETNIDETVDVFPQEALAAGRVSSDYTGLFSRTRLTADSTVLIGYDAARDLLKSGMLLEVNELHNASRGSLMDEFIIEVALNSSGYIIREHPGYAPRVICIIAMDNVTDTIACLTLYFIGYNDDQPVVTYEPSLNVTFTEGQTEFIPIIAGELNVTDPDHPTEYLMMSARVRIEGYTVGYPEFLSVSSQYSNFTYDYNRNSGELTITGEATTDVYQQILSNLTYFNNMTEPLGDSRTISVVVSDGMFQSDAIYVVILINNTNDAPAISLNGVEDPVNQQLSTNYTEGTGAQHIVSNLQVVDTDPNAMIQRVTVNLTNPIDGTDEEISVTRTGMGLTISPSLPSHFVEISGIAPKTVYTDFLRSLTYQHLDFSPGNPSTSESRRLTFYVEDDQNAANIQNSVLELTIIPVNDPPILLFVSDESQRANVDPVLTGQTEMSFTYLEDDPALNFGRDIYLRDVDGNIIFAVLNLTKLRDGVQDHVYADSTLLAAYGVVVETVDVDNLTRIVVLNATSSDGIGPLAFEEILRSLNYINRYQDNRVTDGQRSITITAIDTSGDESGSIRVDITVADRNDGPVIDIGGGDSMDFMITFVENGPSIPIALSHLIDVMDEEHHNISRLRIQLISTNGKLDPSDSIFLRSPMSLAFLDHFASPPNTTYIEIALNASFSVYEQALRAVYFDNSEVEPTIFNATGENVTLTNLTRVIIISITDNNFADSGIDTSDVFNEDLGISTTTIRIGVNIEPINDNPPRIRILASPQGCASGSSNPTDSEANVRRRRDIRAASRIRKRNTEGNDKAPRLISTQAHFTRVSESSMCVNNVTLNFDVHTNIPIAEIPTKLDNLVSFDVQDLNSVQKFGRWMDHQTLSIFFLECVALEATTTSGKMRPINVILESDGDGCDWSTPCSNGVCFANSTGCPVTGTYIINFNQPAVSQETFTHGEGNNEEGRHNFWHHHFIAVVIVLAGILVVAILVCIIAKRQRSIVPHGRKGKKFQKMPSIEDTTIAVFSVESQQQQKKSHFDSRVQDLYPSTASLKPSNNITVCSDHKTIKSLPLDSPSASHQSEDSPTSVTAKEPSLKVPQLAQSTLTAPLSMRDVQSVCNFSAANREARHTNGKYRDTEVTKKEGEKQQSSSKKKKKRAKLTPTKLFTEPEKESKLELQSPLSDDICNWLQLDASDKRKGDPGSQNIQRRHEQSHDHQTVAMDGGVDLPNRIDKLRHHSRDSTESSLAKENRSVLTQRESDLPTPSDNNIRH